MCNMCGLLLPFSPESLLSHQIGKRYNLYLPGNWVLNLQVGPKSELQKGKSIEQSESAGSL